MNAQRGQTPSFNPSILKENRSNSLLISASSTGSFQPILHKGRSQKDLESQDFIALLRILQPTGKNTHI